MSTPVRDDQHGTITGYQYGCRCGDCRQARREYESHPSPAITEAVHAALEREADMDGLVISNCRRVGELAGCSHVWAMAAIHDLAEAGRITVTGRSESRGSPITIQMGDAR